MALDLDIFRNDFAAIIDDLPATFTFNGSQYTGFLGNRVKTEDLEPGGFVDQFDLNLHAPLSVLTSGTWVSTFDTEPELGDFIITSSGTYKVGRLDASQDGVELIMGLRSVNR